jgi:thiamine kinase
MAPAERTAARLERLAERYVPGSGPVRIDPLGSGLVNRSYRVRRDGRAFSLRISAPRAGELGLDRGWECRVLRCAAEAGLAPAVERCEPRAGVLVARWAEGGSWTLGQAGSPATLGAVARLARRVHELPVPGRARRVRPAQWIDFYRRSLDRRRLSPSSKSQDRQRRELAGIAQSALHALDEEPAMRSALCHGDLHVQNLIIAPSAEPVILDWEYAHVSDPWWDLAGWAGNGDLTARGRQLLLRRYLEREPTPQDALRLGRLAWLYDYFCLLWSELYLSSRSDRGAAREAVSERARRLAERLRREP